MHMTQSEFAASIDMDRGLLSRYLNGQIVITRQALTKILGGIKYTDHQGKEFKYVAQWESTILIREQESETGQDAQVADFTSTDQE